MSGWLWALVKNLALSFITYFFEFIIDLGKVTNLGFLSFQIWLLGRRTNQNLLNHTLNKNISLKC